jgi:hypothetical protein
VRSTLVSVAARARDAGQRAGALARGHEHVLERVDHGAQHARGDESDDQDEHKAPRGLRGGSGQADEKHPRVGRKEFHQLPPCYRVESGGSGHESNSQAGPRRVE